MKDKYFNDIIGQEDVKRKLSFYIDGYNKTSMIPHFLFIAEKGCGKTLMAGKVAKHLTIDGKPKRAKELNCSTLKSINQFMEQIMIPFVVDNDVTLVFDEASELPKDITMALLTMLNPNNSNRNTFTTSDGSVIDINFKRHSFMFCTTEPQKVFHALKSRCHRIDFEPYKNNDLMTIVDKNVVKNSNGKIVFSDDVRHQIPTVLRGNPRCAQMMATDILSYCSQFGVKVFDMLNWNKMKTQLGIKPLGLNNTEIQALKILKDNPHSRLVDLSAKLGLTASAVQRDVELFLLKHNLIKMDNGRCLSKNGLEYLKAL